MINAKVGQVCKDHSFFNKIRVNSDSIDKPQSTKVCIKEHRCNNVEVAGSKKYLGCGRKEVPLPHRESQETGPFIFNEGKESQDPSAMSFWV